MLTPHEIFAKKVVPYLKAIIAIKLIENNYTQIEVARLLSVSQAAISQYLDKGLKYYLSRLAEVGIDEEIYKYHVEELVSSNVELDSKEIIEFFNDLYVRLLTSGSLCNIHKKHNILLDECEICILQLSQMGRVEEKDQILNEVKRAYEILCRLPDFKNLIPEVYSNIARAIPRPSSINDIAAFPGRIIKTKDGVKVVGEPTFGASKHLAKILLKINKLYPNILAIMNIKYDDEIYRAVVSSGLKYIYSVRDGNAMGEDVVIEGVYKALKRYGLKYVVFDRGGEGLEPVTYLLGTDSYDVVSKVLAILNAMRKNNSRGMEAVASVGSQ
jgi:predicted fused transcriptional regulator/phosphomethylpyrimidine kinase/predicted transcriptional regulator